MKNIYNEYGMHKNTEDLLLQDHYIINDNLNGEKEREIYYIIAHFTKCREVDDVIKMCYKPIEYLFDNIYYDKLMDRYFYQDEEYKIFFDKFSNYCIDEEEKDRLHSNKRCHCCHKASITYANDFDNSKIISGYTNFLNKKYAHTVIEIEKRGQKVIYDYTTNLVMLKKDWIKLTNFQEISSFESVKIYKDIPMFKKWFELSSRLYLFFRDELMNNVAKNKFLFEENGINLERKLN